MTSRSISAATSLAYDTVEPYAPGLAMFTGDRQCARVGSTSRATSRRPLRPMGGAGGARVVGLTEASPPNPAALRQVSSRDAHGRDRGTSGRADVPSAPLP